MESIAYERIRIHRASAKSLRTLIQPLMALQVPLSPWCLPVPPPPSDYSTYRGPGNALVAEPVLGLIEAPGHQPQIVKAYVRPYDSWTPVVCRDETNKQMNREVQESPHARTGRTQRIEHEYVCNGIVQIFLEVEPLNGRRHFEVGEKRTRKDWVCFIPNSAVGWRSRPFGAALMGGLSWLWGP